VSPRTTGCEPRCIYRYHALVVDLVQITQNQMDENWVPWTRLWWRLQCRSAICPRARRRAGAKSGVFWSAHVDSSVPRGVGVGIQLISGQSWWRCASLSAPQDSAAARRSGELGVHSGKVKVLPRRFRSLGAVRPRGSGRLAIRLCRDSTIPNPGEVTSLLQWGPSRQLVRGRNTWQYFPELAQSVTNGQVAASACCCWWCRLARSLASRLGSAADPFARPWRMRAGGGIATGAPASSAGENAVVSFDPYAPYGAVLETTCRLVTWNVWGRLGEWQARLDGIIAERTARRPPAPGNPAV
jgi:hypothetical protein